MPRQPFYLLLALFLMLAAKAHSQLQITDVQSPGFLSTCKPDTFTVQLSKTPSFSITDSVLIQVSLPAGIGPGGYWSASAGTVFLRQNSPGNVVFSVRNFSGSASSFTFSYSIMPGCNRFSSTTQPADTMEISAVSNSLTAGLQTAFTVNSPWLSLIPSQSHNISNPSVAYNTIYTKRFVYRNTSLTPFSGDVAFLDTVEFAQQLAAIEFLHADITYPPVAIIDTLFTDSSVYINATIVNLAPNDSLVIEETVRITQCNASNNNTSAFMTFRYGCPGDSTLCASSPASSYQTYATLIPAAPHIRADVLDPQQHYGILPYSCPASDDLRIVRVINDGTAGTDSVQISLGREQAASYISYFDTADVDVYYYSGLTQVMLPLASDSILQNTWLPYDYPTSTVSTPDNFSFKIAHHLNPGDSIFFSFREKTLCIDSADRVFQPVTLHGIRIRVDMKDACTNSWLQDPLSYNSRGVWGIVSEKFAEYQFFQNSQPYLDDGDEAWYDIHNLTPPQFNLNHPYFTEELYVNPDHLRLDFDLYVDSALIFQEDSIYFISHQGVNDSIWYPDNVVYEYTNPLQPGEGGRIRASFKIPSSFFTSNALLGAYYGWSAMKRKSAFFHRFFSTSALRFKVKAECNFMPYNAKSEVVQQAFIVYDDNCNPKCPLPVSQVESTINVLCPGCRVPGWNVSTTTMKRTNFGWRDQDNNNRTDQLPPVTAPVTEAHPERITEGDTMVVHITAGTSDGEVLLFSNIGFDYTYGWATLVGDLAERLQYISGYGTLNGSLFQIPPSLVHSGHDSIVVDLTPGTIQMHSNDALPSKFWVGDVFDLYLTFVADSNLVFDGEYVTVQELSTRILMSGVPREQTTDDAGPDENVILTLPPAQRAEYFYWCTGNGGAITTIGHDRMQYSYAVQTDEFGSTCYKQVSMIAMMKMGEQVNSGDLLSNSNQFALNSFPYEVRDFMQFDSLLFTIPSQYYEVHQVRLTGYNLMRDSVTYATEFSCPLYVSNDDYMYSLNLMRQNGDTIVIYPSQIAQYTTELDSSFCNRHIFERGDESKMVLLSLVLKMTDSCSTPDLVPMSGYSSTAWMSNMPSVQPEKVVTGPYVSAGYFAGNLANPSPQFNLQALPQTVYTNVPSVSWQYNMQVVQLPGNFYESAIASISPNTFIAFESPSGNIDVSSLILNSNTYQPIDTINGIPIYGIGTLNPGNYAFTINAAYSCDSSQQIDSLLIFSGYHCYGYPADISQVCGMDTTIVYIVPDFPGLTGTITPPATGGPCDTMYYEAELSATGLGDIEHITAGLVLPPSLSYIAGTGEIIYNNISYFTDPVNDTIFLDTVAAIAGGISSADSTVILRFGVAGGCTYNLEDVTVQIAAENYCGLPIAFTLTDHPPVFVPGPLSPDSIVLSNVFCGIDSVGYEIYFPAATTQPSSVTISVPYPFVFDANDSASLTITHPAGSSGTVSGSFAIWSVVRASCDFDYIVRYTIAGSGSMPCGTGCGDTLVTINDSCVFRLVTPTVQIDQDSCLANCYQLTAVVSSGPAYIQWLLNNVSQSNDTVYNACPSGSETYILTANVSGCTGRDTVTLAPCCPEMQIICADTVIQYNQELCDTFVLTPPEVISDCAVVDLYSDWAGGTFPPGTTAVTWTAVNASGDTVTCVQNITYNPPSLPDTYTIIALSQLQFRTFNRVIPGAVGVLSASGSAYLESNIFINGNPGFVMSPVINSANFITVYTTLIYAIAPVTLPPFVVNPYNSGPNQTIGNNTTVTLSGNVYGTITVGSNSTVIFSGQDTVYALSIQVNGANSTLKFLQGTTVLVKKSLYLGRVTTVNPTHEYVKFYVGGTASSITSTATTTVGSLSLVNACIDNRNGRIDVQLGSSAPFIPTRMNGQFVSRFITSNRYVDWSFYCRCGADSLTFPLWTPKAGEAPGEDGLSLYPNPAHDQVDILYRTENGGTVSLELYDAGGRKVSTVYAGECLAGDNRLTYNVSGLSPGIYVLMLRGAQGDLAYRKLIIE